MVFEKESKDKGMKVVVQEAALEIHAANDPEVLEQHFALEYEVEALRSQIHALTEQVQRDEIQKPNNRDIVEVRHQMKKAMRILLPKAQGYDMEGKFLFCNQGIMSKSGNPTSRLSYLSSMVALIMKNSWTGLTKWKDSLISMRYQTTRR